MDRAAAQAVSADSPVDDARLLRPQRFDFPALATILTYAEFIAVSGRWNPQRKESIPRDEHVSALGMQKRVMGRLGESARESSSCM